MALRMREDDEYFRFRNRAKVVFPEIVILKLHPFIAEEFFYDFSAESLNKNRVYFGGEFKVMKKMKLSIAYIVDSSKADSWSHKNVVQTTLKYSI